MITQSAQTRSLNSQDNQVRPNRSFTQTHRRAEVFRKPIDIETVSDAFSALFEMGKAHGFDHFLLANHHGAGCRSRADDVIITNLPSYIFSQLIEIDIFNHWSVIRKLDDQCASFWTELNTALLKDTVAESRSDGGLSVSDVPTDELPVDTLLYQNLSIQSVFSVPLATCGDSRPFISFFSKSDQTSEFPNAEMAYRAQRIFERVERLIDRSQSPYANVLNARQVQVLSWASLGKTSGEIAQIISLSEHTINHYLKTCCKLLDCMNRTQAVAQALRLKIIK